MAELVNLNNLTIKTDSLLDNWKMVLLDPETGLPAKNITVATFVELFTQKQPVATNNNSGLLSFSLSEYNILTDPLSDSYLVDSPSPANYAPNYSKSEEKYVWSIDKIGKAVLELQDENKQLKQILADNGIEVQIK